MTALNIGVLPLQELKTSLWPSEKRQEKYIPDCACPKRSKWLLSNQIQSKEYASSSPRLKFLQEVNKILFVTGIIDLWKR
ncbi:hypothetical protein N752_08755 [Desulforamulus aquiferis]|nr:hypothetical protein N752_08755 [Desulforamulus aquiferis]